jgi:hypothetical protein
LRRDLFGNLLGESRRRQQAHNDRPWRRRLRGIGAIVLRHSVASDQGAAVRPKVAKSIGGGGADALPYGLLVVGAFRNVLDG